VEVLRIVQEVEAEAERILHQAREEAESISADAEAAASRLIAARGDEAIAQAEKLRNDERAKLKERSRELRTQYQSQMAAMLSRAGERLDSVIELIFLRLRGS
jgi:vacuolar-type H+-ATPase subunit H